MLIRSQNKGNVGVVVVDRVLSAQSDYLLGETQGNQARTGHRLDSDSKTLNVDQDLGLRDYNYLLLDLADLNLKINRGLTGRTTGSGKEVSFNTVNAIDSKVFTLDICTNP